MPHTWLDIDRTLAEMDEFRREMDHLFGALDTGWFRRPSLKHVGWSAWPQAGLYDEGSEFIVQADVPGLEAKDIDLQATQSGLTLSGERGLEEPKGYRVHRQERGSFSFSRSFNFPVKVDSEKVKADVKNGVLTVHIPKAPEVQPRRIAVQS